MVSPLSPERFVFPATASLSFALRYIEARSSIDAQAPALSPLDLLVRLRTLVPHGFSLKSWA